MRIHYISCFTPGDSAETPLLTALNNWKSGDRTGTQFAIAADPSSLKYQLETLDKDNLDVLILGGHGHPSLSGFLVDKTPLRWDDLAFLLRGKLSNSCTFIFYSCDGGYPGIMHLFGRNSGPDFVFGPRISVLADAMTHATLEILKWKNCGGCNIAAARSLVDTINDWASTEYPLCPDQHQFLRVMWCEGANCRYPKNPGIEKHSGNLIPLLGWGL